METKGAPVDVFSDEPYINFVPPPLCPIFTPTEDEFSDALGYINKIKPIVEQYGICKIKPPPDWQPPFAINVDNFKFVPRVQRINELEAKIRTKMTYLNRLIRYWSLQGITLKVPYVDGRFLDLFMLQRHVEQEGGYDAVCSNKLWTKISQIMNYPSNKSIGHILKMNYEKILLPFVIFKTGVACDPVRLQQKQMQKEEVKDDDKPPGSSNADAENGQRKSRRYMKEEPVIDYTANSELKKLQFFGAGPKAAVPTIPYPAGGEFDGTEISEEDVNAKTRQKQGASSKVDTYMCYMCSKGDQEDCMLLCDECDASYHMFCLLPPLQTVPKGDWRCPTCLELECSKPLDVYGFAQSKKEYNLQSFGEIADQFKSDYFNMPVHMVTTEQVEKEYWRLLNTLDEDISVLYGADIHSMEVGSGFPTADTKDMLPEDEEYVTSLWNLNNLSVCDQSILKHINADVSGMKIPWCYVGMCFSTFCWHTEDHWTPSINYLHWGEPKTWYAAPYSSASSLENMVKLAAPELFANTPNLMHQLTTTMNPHMLRLHGVSIVKADQCAGEFIVTMPRAYHTGFNHGYNFAEAVNFAPADWMPIGLDCINHYRQLKRECVFSHEELVCKMAADPDNLDLDLAAYTHSNMLMMVTEEKKLRKALLDRGVVNAEREAFELLPDDERQCSHCLTTCFLSALTCPCSDKIVCIYCMDHLCQCAPSNYVLRYRYTLDELPIMLQRLKTRAESYNTWVAKVTRSLTAEQQDKLSLNDLRDLLTEADDKHYPDSDLLDALTTGINEAEKCSNVAVQLLSKKARTRNRQSGDVKYVSNLSFEELCLFHEQISSLVCVIPESYPLKDLVDRVLDFQNDTQKALADEEPNTEKLEKLLQTGVSLDIELTEIPRLKEVLEQAKWLDKKKASLADASTLTLDEMRSLLQSGVVLAPHAAVERAMAELQELLTLSERWEEKARICLQAKPRHMITTLEAIINEARAIPAHLPNIMLLQDAMRKAKDWCAKVDRIQMGDTYPYVETLDALLAKGRTIPVRLDQLPQLESQVAAAKSWRERTSRTFLKKNSTHTLFEVLSPRTDIGSFANKNRKKKRDGDTKEILGVDVKFDDTTDPASMVTAFKNAEKQELDSMTELRLRNIEKYHHSGDNYDDMKFCVCRKGPAGFMLQCELCKDCFHSTCVPLPKSAGLKNKPSSRSVQLSRDFKFLCPLCLQSRRPRLETILSLLVSLQKLPVRLQEGEALQCLTERAMAWQDRARQSLATPELASALAKLSVLSQKMVEQAAREKTEKIINAELMKAASNPDLQEHLASVTQSAFKGIHQPEIVKPDWLPTMEAMTDASTDPKSPIDDTELISVCGEDKDQLLTTGQGSVTEHTYSSVSKNSAAHSGASPRKQPRKSPLVPRQETPLLELSSLARAQLEELMMEGDLLEVSLDETQHLWRILQACKSANEARFFDMQPVQTDVKPSFSSLGKKLFMKKKKKRLFNEDGEVVKIKKIKREGGLTVEERIMKKKELMKEKKEKLKVKIKSEAAVDPTFEKLVIDETKKKKKLKVKLDPVKLEKRRLKKLKKATMKKEDVNDDDCSANKCLRPLGEEVNWVQCDGCELWFHLLCVGIGDNELKDDEEYKCSFCDNRKTNKTGVVVKTENVSDDEHYGGDANTEKQHSSLDAMKSLLTQLDNKIREPTGNEAGSDAAVLMEGDAASGGAGKDSGMTVVEKLSSMVSAIHATGLDFQAKGSELSGDGRIVAGDIGYERGVDDVSDVSEALGRERGQFLERKLSEELDVVDISDADEIRTWKESITGNLGVDDVDDGCGGDVCDVDKDVGADESDELVLGGEGKNDVDAQAMVIDDAESDVEGIAGGGYEAFEKGDSVMEDILGGFMEDDSEVMEVEMAEDSGNDGLDGVDGSTGGLDGDDGSTGGLDGDDGRIGGLDGDDGRTSGLGGDDGSTGGLDGDDGRTSGLDGNDGSTGGLDDEGKTSGFNEKECRVGDLDVRDGRLGEDVVVIHDTELGIPPQVALHEVDEFATGTGDIEAIPGRVSAVDSSSVGKMVRSPERESVLEKFGLELTKSRDPSTKGIIDLAVKLREGLPRIAVPGTASSSDAGLSLAPRPAGSSQSRSTEIIDTPRGSREASKEQNIFTQILESSEYDGTEPS